MLIYLPDSYGSGSLSLNFLEKLTNLPRQALQNSLVLNIPGYETADRYFGLGEICTILEEQIRQKKELQTKISNQLNLSKKDFVSDLLRDNKVVLVTLRSGAFIAWKMISSFPSLFKGLIIIDSGSGVGFWKGRQLNGELKKYYKLSRKELYNKQLNEKRLEYKNLYSTLTENTEHKGLSSYWKIFLSWNFRRFWLKNTKAVQGVMQNIPVLYLQPTKQNIFSEKQLESILNQFYPTFKQGKRYEKARFWTEATLEKKHIPGSNSYLWRPNITVSSFWNKPNNYIPVCHWFISQVLYAKITTNPTGVSSKKEFLL